ncbi:MAG: type II toxin-antitoxin system RelE/ParE family toxin [Saccharofermentans sp.]|nr:type II toxin-antitoxin system RelE/ParE family toxin [Saccharofermentans sp.]
MDKIESKSEFPLSGSPLYYEELFTGYRFITFKAYLVFYHVEGKEILVDRILYGKSDYIRRLKLKDQD